MLNNRNLQMQPSELGSSMKKILPVFGLTALLVGATASVQATDLPPGGSVVPAAGGVSGAISAETDLHYTLLAGATVKGTGTVHEVVVSGDLDNPLGGLTFVYQTLVSTGDIARLTASGFAGIPTDVIAADASSVIISLIPPFASGGVLPLLADRTALLTDGADTVGFSFRSAIDPAEQNSELMIIRTDAVLFGPGDIGLSDSGVDGSGTDRLSGLSPAATGSTVPEPGTLLLGLEFAGLLSAFVAVRRWRSSSPAERASCAVPTTTGGGEHTVTNTTFSM